MRNALLGDARWTRHLWWISLLALQACSKPVFYFRGYSSLSDCRTIIDSELVTGATFDDAVEEALENGPGIVTELSGSILDVAVAIDVACYGDGSVAYIDYSSLSDDVDPSTRIYETFSNNLDEIAGPVEERQFPDMRVKNYLCDESGRIALSQARLAEDQFEVSMLVIPHRTEC